VHAKPRFVGGDRVSFDFLPQWIIAAGAPALSVIAFFWKGDDALSQDFKQWLSQKILRVKLTVPDISSIEPLGKVFDFIYGRRYFALSTFLRVAAISTIAIVVAWFVLRRPGDHIVNIWVTIQSSPANLISVFIVNVFFDYLSVTKSRFLINKIAQFHKKYDVIIFIFIDLIFTAIIVFCYVATWELTAMVPPLWVLNTYVSPAYALDFAGPLLNFVDSLKLLNLPSLNYMSPTYYSLFQAFALTTFLTLLLATVYSISLLLLMFFNFLGKTPLMRWLVPENMLSIIRWVLPVESLPVRSIGIVAGVFVFVFVAALRTVT
jgi:hypothetical protein